MCNKILTYAIGVLVCLFEPGKASAQQMTLNETIALARTKSVEALEAKQAFVSTYWQWRAYKASRLPSLYLYGNLMNFDRSIALLQSPDDGAMRYVSSHNLQNGIGLQARQNITITGGTLYVFTDLNRIDQFGANRSISWYSQPITIYYEQPLFAYNQFKWDKQIEPKEYEKGKRIYIETMEKISGEAVAAYYDLLLARTNETIAQTNYENTGKMHQVAAERLRLGTVTRDEYLQLELRMLNDSIAINENAIRVREKQMLLNSLLGLDDSYDILPVLDERLPDITVRYETVQDKVFANSSFNLDNEIILLNAQSAVEKAKAERGITMGFNARFGLSKTAPAFSEVYFNPLDQEVFGLTFSVPIFDWGQGKGRVQKARAAEEVAKAQIQQSENDLRRTIFTAVGQFNNQRQQCSVSRRAADIAGERYALMMDKFRAGSATVTDLNTAQSENDSARQQYIQDLRNFWVYYYTLRQYTLFDFIRGEDIDVNVNEMIE
jgi:outer membrane protein TolC